MKIRFASQSELGADLLRQQPIAVLRPNESIWRKNPQPSQTTAVAMCRKSRTS